MRSLSQQEPFKQDCESGQTPFGCFESHLSWHLPPEFTCPEGQQIPSEFEVPVGQQSPFEFEVPSRQHKPLEQDSPAVGQ
jgi:hypothetical protein